MDSRSYFINRGLVTEVEASWVEGGLRDHTTTYILKTKPSMVTAWQVLNITFRFSHLSSHIS